jgi:hypothetical protein
MRYPLLARHRLAAVVRRTGHAVTAETSRIINLPLHFPAFRHLAASKWRSASIDLVNAKCFSIAFV